MKSFFKSPPSWREIGIYILIVVVILSGYAFLNTRTTQSEIGNRKSEISYTTVHPQVSQSFSVQKLIGRVRSNNFAMIHPRREGIVKDIFVDVGDSVTEGQTLALLLPPGVEGQSSAQIDKAYAELLSAQESLKNAEQVALDTVKTSKRNLEQTQTLLENVQSSDSTKVRSQLSQSFDNAKTIVTQSLQNMRRILFGTEQSQQVSATSVLGHFNNSIQKQNVFNVYEQAEKAEKEFLALGESSNESELKAYMNAVSQLLTEAETLYRNAQVSRSHTQMEIEQHIATIQLNQRNVLSAQEKLDNTILAVKQLSASLSQAEQNFELSQSQSDTNTDAARNRVDIARSAYQAILAQNGNVKVVSPFSGTISQRFVDVGQMVMPSKALFEIVDVGTSLGQNTAFEVQFGLPEELMESVEVGDSVEVTLPYLGNKTLPATVTRKSDSLEMSSRTVITQAVLENLDENLRNNTSVFVRLVDKRNPVFSIPTTSLKRRGNQYFAWVLDEEGQPRSLELSVLAEDGEWSDVVGMLSLKSNLITNPSVTLFRTSTPLQIEEQPEEIQDAQQIPNPDQP